MKRDYLGDSYDAVKRLWQQALADWAPLYANARFVPLDLQKDFTRLTGIPMLGANSQNDFSILNDPDTGIRLPDEANQNESRTHIALATISDQLRTSGARTVITFDQSDYRHGDLKLDKQRAAKMRYLTDQGYFAFYYVSHAPFLFAFADSSILKRMIGRLQEFGIPSNRFELYSIEAEQ